MADDFTDLKDYTESVDNDSDGVINSLNTKRTNRGVGSNANNNTSGSKISPFGNNLLGNSNKLSIPKNFNKVDNNNVYNDIENDGNIKNNGSNKIKTPKNNKLSDRIENIRNKLLGGEYDKDMNKVADEEVFINEDLETLTEKDNELKKQEIVDKINALVKSDAQMRKKENGLMKQGNKILDKEYNSLFKLADDSFNIFEVNEKQDNFIQQNQMKQQIFQPNIKGIQSQTMVKQESQIQSQQQVATTSAPASTTTVEGSLFSPLLDDASAVDSGLFNSIYPKYNKNKYVKLRDFTTNQDLADLVNDRPDLESLDMSNCNLIYDFSPISKLKHLKEFAAHNCQLLENVDFLSNTEELEVLNISATSVSNISNVLPHLKQLKVLNLAVTKINSLVGIENCKDLIELILWGCLGISDLSPLENIYNLRVLDIDFANVRDIFPLNNSRKLEILYADNCDGIKDLSTFETLKKLKFLSFSGSSILPLNQLNYFSSLENIQVLDLSSRKISTASVFGNLKKLVKLDLNGCAFADCSPLSNLEQLQQIDMTGNSQLRDISSLSTLKKLKKLIIGGGGTSKLKNKTAGVSTTSNMYIEDISVIADLPSLEELDINSNPKVRSLAGIKNCPNMEEIVMNKCTQMEEISELRFLTNLTKIEMNFCPKIKDLYFIQYLPNLMFLLFDGTVVDSAKFLSNFKKSLGIKALVGYGNDMLSQNVIKSAKKRLKSHKLMKKIIKLEEN